MANIVQFALQLRDNLSGPMRQAAASVSNFVGRFREAQAQTAKGSSAMGSSFAGLAKLAGAAFSVTAIIGLGKEIIGLGANMEQTRVRYEVFTGSAKAAGEAIAVVSQLATKTPFQKSELLEYGQQLLGAGLQTEEMGQKLTTLGNISSATGKNLGELTALYVKNKGSGIIQGEDLNQLADAKIPLDQFAKQLGTNVMGLKKMASQGKVTFGDLDKYFESLGGTQGKWGDLNEKMSNTLAGKWSNLKDTLEQMFSDAGEGVVPGLKTVLDVLNQVLGWIQSNKAGIAAMFEPLRKALEPVFDALGGLYAQLGLTGDVGTTLTNVFNGIGYAIELISPFIRVLAEILGSVYTNVGKIIAVFADWVSKNETVKKSALFLYNTLKTVFTAIGSIASQVFGGISKTIDGILHADFGKIGDGLIEIVTGPADTLTDPATYDHMDDAAPTMTDYFAKKKQDDAATATASAAKKAAGPGAAKADSTKLTSKIGEATGTKLTSLSIHIDRLYGIENQNNTTMKDAVRGAGEEVKRALLSAINDVSITASQN